MDLGNNFINSFRMQTIPWIIHADNTFINLFVCECTSAKFPRRATFIRSCSLDWRIPSLTHTSNTLINLLKYTVCMSWLINKDNMLTNSFVCEYTSSQPPQPTPSAYYLYTFMLIGSENTFSNTYRQHFNKSIKVLSGWLIHTDNTLINWWWLINEDNILIKSFVCKYTSSQLPQRATWMIQGGEDS